MRSKALNYDPLAPEYDRRYKEGDWRPIAELLERALWAANPGRVLEVGCGTGHWLDGGSPGADVVGLDESFPMLERAAENVPAAFLLQADAGHLPLAACSFEAIYCINALHHFPDPQRFLRMAERTLAPEGELLLVGLDAHDPNLEWYLYRYFEGVRARDLKRYPRFDHLDGWLRALDLQVTAAGVAQSIERIYVGREVWADPYLARGATSQLALLSEEEYQQGFGALQRAVRTQPQQQHRVGLKLRYLLAERR